MSGIIGDNVGRSSGLIKAVSVSAGMTLILSTDISSSVSVVGLDNVFTSTYDLYRVYGYNIFHASNADDGWLRFLLNSDGSAYTGGGYERVYWYAGNAGTFSSSANASTSDTKLQINASVGSSDASQSMSFVADIFNPMSTSFEKIITCTSFTKGSGNIWLWKSGCTLNQDSTAMRGIEYQGGSYNVAGGKFRVYGITNS